MRGNRHRVTFNLPLPCFRESHMQCAYDLQCFFFLYNMPRESECFVTMATTSCSFPRNLLKKSDYFEYFYTLLISCLQNIFITGAQKPSISEVGYCLHYILLCFQETLKISVPLELHLANSLHSDRGLLENISVVSVREVDPHRI